MQKSTQIASVYPFFANKTNPTWDIIANEKKLIGLLLVSY
jgi:hypothetical protein